MTLWGGDLESNDRSTCRHPKRSEGSRCLEKDFFEVKGDF